MGLFNSSNPALNENTLREVTAVYGTEAMTLNGTIWKTVLGVALTFAGGLYAVYATLQNPASMQALLWVGLIGGLIAAIYPWDDLQTDRRSLYHAHLRRAGGTGTG